MNKGQYRHYAFICPVKIFPTGVFREEIVTATVTGSDLCPLCQKKIAMHKPVCYTR